MPIQVQFPPPSHFCMHWDTGHPHKHTTECSVRHHTLAKTHRDAHIVLKSVSDGCSEDFRLLRVWRYVEQVRHEEAQNTHPLIHSHSCSTSSRGLMNRPMMGSASCPAPHQSRRFVTEGSSSTSCDSTPTIWVMGLPRRSRRFSLGQEASGWRSASFEISVCLG